MLKIYNSLTKQKEVFIPLESGKVRMYVCGMTVYDYSHLGHARSLVSFDVVVRYLRHCGYAVRYVRNMTDIDDKIIRRAQENGEPVTALTERFIEALQEDARQLGLVVPDEEPRATQYIPHIIALVQKLLDKGYAYVTDTGDVCFAIAEFKSYGKLSHRDVDDLRVGARVQASDAKQDPLDFVLWKAAKPDEPAWDAPWGKGRPGWHIECSAMAMNTLGESIDIHGGGADLKFPHHENEIAQSEAATDRSFAQYWMHVGHLKVDQEKMSKSLHNFITIRDILREIHPEVLRYLLIASHYRSPVNYSEAMLSQAHQALERLYTALRPHADAAYFSSDDPEIASVLARFTSAMDDDFNTPEALAVLFDIAREINRLGKDARAEKLAGVLRNLGGVLGLLQADPEAFLQHAAEVSLDVEQRAEIESLIAGRLAARQSKDWAEADRIRDQLSAMGVVLEDGADGTTWRMA